LNVLAQKIEKITIYLLYIETIKLVNMIMNNNNETDQIFLKNIKLNRHMWTLELVNYAAQRGYYESLVYLCENNCRVDVLACAWAARSNQLKCLRYLHENEYEWSEQTVIVAAQMGQTQCLKYAIDNDCPVPLNICYYASVSGHSDCVEYLTSKKFKCDVNTCYMTTENGHLECLKRIFENLRYTTNQSGHETIKNVCAMIAQDNKHAHIIDHLAK
jgi:hypothetical protein